MGIEPNTVLLMQFNEPKSSTGGTTGGICPTITPTYSNTKPQPYNMWEWFDVDPDGKFGQAVKFIVPSNKKTSIKLTMATFYAGESATVEYWIKLIGGNNQTGCPIYLVQLDGAPSKYQVPNIGFGINGGVPCVKGYSNNAVPTPGNCGSRLSANTWHHLAFEIYATDPKKSTPISGNNVWKMLRVYVDGAMVKEYEFYTQYKYASSKYPCPLGPYTGSVNQRNAYWRFGIESKNGSNQITFQGTGNFSVDELKVFNTIKYNGSRFTPPSSPVSLREPYSKKLWCIWNGSGFGHNLYLDKATSPSLEIPADGKTLYGDLVAAGASGAGHIHVISGGKEYVVKA